MAEVLTTWPGGMRRRTRGGRRFDQFFDGQIYRLNGGDVAGYKSAVIARQTLYRYASRLKKRVRVGIESRSPIVLVMQAYDPAPRD